MYRSCYYRSCCSSYFSDVVRGYKKRQACTFIKKRLWHRCFPVNCATFLRNLFLQNTSRWLLQTFVTGRKVFRNLSDNVDFFKIIYGKVISSRTLSHLILLRQSCEKCPNFKQTKQAILLIFPYVSPGFYLHYRFAALRFMVFITK